VHSRAISRLTIRSRVESLFPFRSRTILRDIGTFYIPRPISRVLQSSIQSSILVVLPTISRIPRRFRCNLFNLPDDALRLLLIRLHDDVLDYHYRSYPTFGLSCGQGEAGNLLEEITLRVTRLAPISRQEGDNAFSRGYVHAYGLFRTTQSTRMRMPSRKQGQTPAKPRERETKNSKGTQKEEERKENERERERKKNKNKYTERERERERENRKWMREKGATGAIEIRNSTCNSTHSRGT